MSQQKSKKTGKVPKVPAMTIAMSAYNEEDNIVQAINDARSVLETIASEYEILVVDDGSVDNTGKIADDFANKNKNVRVVHHPKNLGVGMANKTCYNNARYDLIFWNAADNQIHMGEVIKMLPLIKSSDIIVGKRRNRADSPMRRLTSGTYNLVLRIFFGLNVHDADSVKLIKRKVLEKVRLTSKSAFVDTELLIKARKNKFRVRETLIKHYPRRYGTARGNSFKIVHKQLMDLAKFWLYSKVGKK